MDISTYNTLRKIAGDRDNWWSRAKRRTRRGFGAATNFARGVKNTAAKKLNDVGGKVKSAVNGADAKLKQGVEATAGAVKRGWEATKDGWERNVNQNPYVPFSRANREALKDTIEAVKRDKLRAETARRIESRTPVVRTYPDAASWVDYYNKSPKFRKLVNGNSNDRAKAAQLVAKSGVPQLGPYIESGVMPTYSDPEAIAAWENSSRNLFAWNNFKNIFRSESSILNDRGNDPTQRNRIFDTVNINPPNQTMDDRMRALYRMYVDDDSYKNLPKLKQLHEMRQQARVNSHLGTTAVEWRPQSRIMPIDMSGAVGERLPAPTLMRRLWEREFSVNDPVDYYMPNYNAGGNRRYYFPRSYAARWGLSTFGGRIPLGVTRKPGQLGAEIYKDRATGAVTYDPNGQHSVALHEGGTLFGHTGTDDNVSWGTSDPETRIVQYGAYGDPAVAVRKTTLWPLTGAYKGKLVPEDAISSGKLMLASSALSSDASEREKKDADEWQQKVIAAHNRMISTGNWEPYPIMLYGNSMTELCTYVDNIKNIAATRDGALVTAFDPEFGARKGGPLKGDINSYMVSNGFWTDNWANPKFDRTKGYRFSTARAFNQHHGSQLPLHRNLRSPQHTRFNVDIGVRDVQEIINYYFYLQALGSNRTKDQTADMNRILAILQRGMPQW